MDVSKVATSVVLKAFEISSVTVLLGYSFANVLMRNQNALEVGNDIHVLCLFRNVIFFFHNFLPSVLLNRVSAKMQYTNLSLANART